MFRSTQCFVSTANKNWFFYVNYDQRHHEMIFTLFSICFGFNKMQMEIKFLNNMFPILDPPKIHPEIEKEIYFTRGETKSITCSAVGSPNIHVSWNDNESQSQSNVLEIDTGNVRFSAKNNFSATCTATNDYGSDSYTIHVHIFGKHFTFEASFKFCVLTK